MPYVKACHRTGQFLVRMASEEFEGEVLDYSRELYVVLSVDEVRGEKCLCVSLATQRPVAGHAEA